MVMGDGAAAVFLPNNVNMDKQVVDDVDDHDDDVVDVIGGRILGQPPAGIDDIDSNLMTDMIGDGDNDDAAIFLDREVVNTSAELTSSASTAIQSSSINQQYNDTTYNKSGWLDDQYPSCDISTSHIQMGCIVLPIQMTLPPEKKETFSAGGSDPHGNEAPSYSIGNISRISLYAAYPPPFPISSNPTTTIDEYDDCDENGDNKSDLQQKKLLLHRYSGWYGTTSIHSATTTTSTESYGVLGYSESTMSLNYRCPFFVVVPSLLSSSTYFYDGSQGHGRMREGQRQHQQQHRRNRRSRRRHHHLITDLHCTMHLGPSTSTTTVANINSILPSIGTTLSTSDGRTQLRVDACSNNWLRWGRSGNRAMKMADRQSDYYTVCASRDFFRKLRGPSSSYLPPLRAHCALKLLPYQPFHKQNFLVTLSTMINDSTTTEDYDRRNGNVMRRYDTTRRVGQCDGRNCRPRPYFTLCLGYGVPPVSSTSAEMQLNGANFASSDSMAVPLYNDYYYRTASDSSRKGGAGVVVVPASSMYSAANLKLNVEQRLPSSSRSSSSSSSIWHGTIEYLHAGRVLTFGTMMTRSFATSKFSRLGVGIRQSFFGNVLQHGGSLDRPWWGWLAEAGCATSWLFQLERGGVRLLVPVTFGGGSTMIASTWRTSLIGLIFASLASVVADVLACELFCGITSRLRLRFLSLLLGEEYVNNRENDDHGDDDEHWLEEQLSKVKEDAMCQVHLMEQQARAMAKKEEETGGLVIVKAVYGVMDNESRLWLSRRNRRGSEDVLYVNNYYTMDATTQLQFWVANSALQLPALSKKHLLGFYDVMAYVGEDGWVAVKDDDDRAEFNQINSIRSVQTGFVQLMKKWWKGTHRFGYKTMKQRDLKVVLSIRFKLEDKLYDVIFDDEQAIELPCRFAQEVIGDR